MALLNAILLQIFQNRIKKSPTLLPLSLAKHLEILKKSRFICSDKRISDNNRYNAGGIITLEQGVIYVHKVDNKDTRTTPWQIRKRWKIC